MQEAYIGDGVYVTFDGRNVALDLRAQAPTDPTRIVLEPTVLKALLVFLHAQGALEPTLRSIGILGADL